MQARAFVFQLRQSRNPSVYTYNFVYIIVVCLSCLQQSMRSTCERCQGCSYSGLVLVVRTVGLALSAGPWVGAKLQAGVFLLSQTRNPPVYTYSFVHLIVVRPSCMKQPMAGYLGEPLSF